MGAKLFYHDPKGKVSANLRVIVAVDQGSALLPLLFSCHGHYHTGYSTCSVLNTALCLIFSQHFKTKLFAQKWSDRLMHLNKSWQWNWQWFAQNWVSYVSCFGALYQRWSVPWNRFTHQCNLDKVTLQNTVSFNLSFSKILSVGRLLKAMSPVLWWWRRRYVASVE